MTRSRAVGGAFNAGRFIFDRHSTGKTLYFRGFAAIWRKKNLLPRNGVQRSGLVSKIDDETKIVSKETILFAQKGSEGTR
ncbi:MAG: hypothetical protein ACU83P_04145 [Gammaproteobacteria bacterium]